VQGIVTPAQRGQDTIDQGVILVGREGDNGILSPGKRMFISKSTALYETILYWAGNLSPNPVELIFPFGPFLHGKPY
jgi:hypothetical protein